MKEIVMKILSCAGIQHLQIFILGGIVHVAATAAGRMGEMDSPRFMQVKATMPTVMVKLRKRSFDRVAKDDNDFNIRCSALQCLQCTGGAHVVRAFVKSKLPRFTLKTA